VTTYKCHLQTTLLQLDQFCIYQGLLIYSFTLLNLRVESWNFNSSIWIIGWFDFINFVCWIVSLLLNLCLMLWSCIVKCWLVMNLWSLFNVDVVILILYLYCQILKLGSWNFEVRLRPSARQQLNSAVSIGTTGGTGVPLGTVSLCPRKNSGTGVPYSRNIPCHFIASHLPKTGPRPVRSRVFLIRSRLGPITDRSGPQSKTLPWFGLRSRLIRSSTSDIDLV